MLHTYLHDVEFHLATVQEKEVLWYFSDVQLRVLRSEKKLVIRIEVDSFRAKEMKLYISSIIQYHWLLGSTIPFGPISHGNEI
jgi:hypothetical protein